MSEPIKKISERNKTIYVSAIVLMLCALAVTFVLLFLVRNDNSEVIYQKLCLTIFGMIFSMLLFIFGFLGKPNIDRHGHMLSAVIVLLFVELCLMSVIDILRGTDGSVAWIFGIVTFCNILVAPIHLLLWNYQCDSLPNNKVQRRCTYWIWFLLIAYILLNCLNTITHWLFVIDPNGYIVYNTVNFDTILLALVYVTYLIYILIQQCDRKKKLALMSIAIAPLLCIVISVLWAIYGAPYINESMNHIFMLVAVYIVFFNDYLRDKEDLDAERMKSAEQAKKETELRTELMLVQIGPHFLYNALGSISSLCRIEGAMTAKNAVDHFSDYLRHNLDSLHQDKIVPFETELEHVKTYLWLEKMRFGDDLKVEYDIRYDQFGLPSLIVQPLVENAVRHGLFNQRGGGTVKIITDRTAQGVVVTIADDGVGFDPNQALNDEKVHIGIDNVRYRLKSLCGGELRISSAAGIGTIAEIRIDDEQFYGENVDLKKPYDYLPHINPEYYRQ